MNDLEYESSKSSGLTADFSATLLKISAQNQVRKTRECNCHLPSSSGRADLQSIGPIGSRRLAYRRLLQHVMHGMKQGYLDGMRAIADLILNQSIVQAIIFTSCILHQSYQGEITLQN